VERNVGKFRRYQHIKKNLASYNRSLTFDGSDNSCNLIGQYSVLLFILKFDWLMESTQIFHSQIGQFVQS